MRIVRPLVAVAVLVLAAARFPVWSAVAAKEIVVSAGARDRRDTVVRFRVEGLPPGAHALRSGDGARLDLQVEEGGEAWFVLPDLPAGGSRTYRLEADPAGAPGSGVAAIEEGEDVRFAREGKLVLRYRGGAGVLPGGDVKPVFRRGGYLHPVQTPSGRVVTDDYPPDHRHHHGVWFAWTKTEFQGRTPDFWNMGDGKGAVTFVSLERTWSGTVHGGLRARHRYVDLGAGTPVGVLDEAWETRVYAVGRGAQPYFLFDVEVLQKAGTSSSLVLPEYHYGGLGFRGSKHWLGAQGAVFLTSEGKDRTNGHATRARWTHVSGPIEGGVAGLAILGHPENFRAPQPVRIHPTDPFFCFAPSQMGRWEIAPGHPYAARYRFVVADGKPSPAEVERLWQDYADPPRVVAR